MWLPGVPSLRVSGGQISFLVPADWERLHGYLKGIYWKPSSIPYKACVLSLRYSLSLSRKLFHLMVTQWCDSNSHTHYNYFVVAIFCAIVKLLGNLFKQLCFVIYVYLRTLWLFLYKHFTGSAVLYYWHLCKTVISIYPIWISFTVSVI